MQSVVYSKNFVLILQAKEIADLQSKLDESSGKIHSLQGQVIKIQVNNGV